MSITVGVDVGATFYKVCVMRDRAIISLIKSKTPIMQTAYFSEFRADLEQQYGNLRIVSCGYGRSNVGSDKQVSELTALAVGASLICPEVHTLWDIGGQDTKLILCGDNGKVSNFVLNDKCAAGCGIFLMNTLHLLGFEFDKISLNNEKVTPLSSVCAVYAQTEIVNRVAMGENKEQLLAAVVSAIVKQSTALFNKIAVKPTVALTGGLSEIDGIIEIAVPILGTEISIPQYSSYLSAIGCAIIAEGITGSL